MMAVKEVLKGLFTPGCVGVPFCKATDKGLPDDHGALELASGEVISFDITFSEDGLTRTTTTIFRDEATREIYNDHGVFKAAMLALKQEDESNNITKTVTNTEV